MTINEFVLFLSSSSRSEDLRRVHRGTWDCGWNLQTLRNHIQHSKTQVGQFLDSTPHAYNCVLDGGKPLLIHHLYNQFFVVNVCFSMCAYRQEFCSELCPDLTKEVYLQDIHCVGSLCKLYFRELPNPLLTYELYKKFTVSM